MSTYTTTPFSAIAVERGYLTPEASRQAEELSATTGAGFAATVSRLGLMADADIAFLLSDLLNIRRAENVSCKASGSSMDLNPRFLRRHNVMPIMGEDGAPVLMVADPTDRAGIDGLNFVLGCNSSLILATFSELEARLDICAMDREKSDLGVARSLDDLSLLAEGVSEAPVIRMVQRLLGNAIKQRASDVHIEPGVRQLAVRYRIDGRLSEVERHAAEWAEPIVSRVKVMAGLDIAESRLPQDGRLRLTVQGREVDVRVSTSPVAHGESVVLRLLGRSEVPIELERLGLPPAALVRLTAALDRPHGIILITGPTGSGKTTTLYAAINRLRRPEVKILSVEDPVEMLLEGINQVQVRPEIDLSYAATLRAFLRQDPDILMIGEIRDGETAEIALRAALTGHLVLSTLHTNTALGAFTRLTDIGIQPYLAASTVIASVAQRLIRALCPACASARPLSREEAALYTAYAMPVPTSTLDPGGCTECQQSGYRGRLPLIEIVTVDEVLRHAIREGRAESYLPPQGPAETLLGHGLALAAEGRTSLAEVRRAVQLT